MPKLLCAFGRKQTLAVWAREYGFIYQSLRYRINNMGYSLEDALTEPLHIREEKTHCKNGHHYTKENTYIYARGRACRTCLERNLKKWKNNNREKVLANSRTQNAKHAVKHLPKELRDCGLVLRKARKALVKIPYKGTKKTIAELAGIAKVSREAIHRRIYTNGMTSEEAVNHIHLKKYSAFGKTKLLPKWAKEYKIHPATIRTRLRYGYTLEDALTKHLYSHCQNQHEHLYSAFGKTQTLSKWAYEYKISKSALKSRIARGKRSMEKALTKRRRYHVPLYTAFGKTQILSEWAREYGIKSATLYVRVKREGLTLEQALTVLLRHGKLLSAFGYKKDLATWAREYGIKTATLRKRMKDQNLTLEQALTVPLQHCKPLLAFGRTQYLNRWGKEYGISSNTLYARIKRQSLTLEQALLKG